MTVELIREIAGHVLAIGILGWGAYMTINGQPVPDWLVAAIGAVITMYFPGIVLAVKARVYRFFGVCC